jgi:hypothetical protein
MEDPPDQVKDHFARHEGTIGDFIHALQRLKYEDTRPRDREISDAVAAFERATCSIPPPGGHRPTSL